jgi:hypothetical protein
MLLCILFQIGIQPPPPPPRPQPQPQPRPQQMPSGQNFMYIQNFPQPKVDYVTYETEYVTNSVACVIS